MDKTEFLTVFPTFEKLETVKKTLPSVIAEVKRSDARLIVHDSTVKGRDEKWSYLRELNKDNDFFLILSDNISMAQARNMCMQLGIDMYQPEYICAIDDDHGFEEGLIPRFVEAIKKNYGKVAPNGLRYGIFTSCTVHNAGTIREPLEDNCEYPVLDQHVWAVGCVNNCIRCTTTSHWQNILKGWDNDEYNISFYQCEQMRYRNYYRGFTSFYLAEGGPQSFAVDTVGRGDSKDGQWLWDPLFTASDGRSNYHGKKGDVIPSLYNRPRSKFTVMVDDTYATVRKILKLDEK